VAYRDVNTLELYLPDDQGTKKARKPVLVVSSARMDLHLKLSQRIGYATTYQSKFFNRSLA